MCSGKDTLSWDEYILCTEIRQAIDEYFTLLNGIRL